MFLAELGTAVALGVMLDTIIVRSVLVTAINLDLGGKIWWPSALDRKPPVEPSGAGTERSPSRSAEKRPSPGPSGVADRPGTSLT